MSSARHPAVDVLRKVMRIPHAAFGVVFITLTVLVALLAPWIAPYPYDAIDPAHGLEPPSAAHLLSLIHI